MGYLGEYDNNLKITMNKIRVNIATSHRFHLLDLARELDKQGFDVRFYSYVPPKRCLRFGLPRKCCSSLFWIVFPFLVLQKLFGYKSTIVKYRNQIMDYYLSQFMRPCDVYIALGTVYKHSFVTAKKRFGAKTILEWGSMHIDEQQEILANCHGTLNKEYFNKRSREGYEIVDYIAIPAIHTRNSFVKHGISEEKLLQNPYGVDVSMFYPDKKQNKIYDLIMVGNWSRQKGCDLIVEAVKILNLKFIHVGAIVDLPIPKESNFTHIDPVDQSELVKYYNMAKIFILPSRQEGLAMVQVQAIACNLPMIGSPHSGALDLKGMVECPEFITIIQDWTVSSVVSAINDAMALQKTQKDNLYAGNALYNLTWEAYGKRYTKGITEILSL